MRGLWVRLFGLVIFSSVCSCGGVSMTHVSRGDLEVYTFTGDSTNAYLLVHDKSLVLVDSGYESNGERLEPSIRSAGFDPAKIGAIFLSHGHADHAGGARYFQQRLHVPVFAGAGDQAMLAAGKNEPLCPVGLLGHLRHGTDQGATFTPMTPDRLIDAPLPLEPLTGVPAVVVPLAGHTRGSLVVVAGDAAFVGDLFRGSLIGSGAETHLYMCDLEGNRQDVAKLLKDIAPHAQIFFTGHFGPVTRQDVAEHFDVKEP